jgi:sugar (pentulose or hexulose) kinase
MTVQKNYLAFDIGASNGRCINAHFDGEILGLDVLHRFENGPVRANDHLYWNILGLWDSVHHSLAKASLEDGMNFASIGIDTWAVDFGLLDKQGALIGNPFCYRDPQTQGMMQEAFQYVPQEELFQITGIQFMELNTLFQLLAMVKAGSPALDIAHTFLMIPDLLNYWMTGRKACEYTNASTTQLLNAKLRDWDYPLIHAMHIPDHIFPEVLEPGQVMGELNGRLCSETGLSPVPVISVGSHDTAAAVASVPATGSGFAYLSSGTWGLLGVELPEAVLTEKVLKYNFGNEGGVAHTVRLLRNIVNMWLLQECRRIWALEGQELSWSDITRLSERADPFTAFIDPDAPEFILPDHMPRTIQDYCRRAHQNVPQSKSEIVRVCIESLAFKYRYTIDKIFDILDKRPTVLHIVGGGAQNKILCQFAANAVNIPVIAGPYEATALGNILLQMIAVGDLADLAEGRMLIDRSFPTEVFLPTNTDRWEEQYHRFLAVTGNPTIWRKS